MYGYSWCTHVRNCARLDLAQLFPCLVLVLYVCTDNPFSVVDILLGGDLPKIDSPFLL